MAHAKLENSKRLQRVLRLLSDGEPHDTRDIQNNALVCAASACIQELRLNGKQIRRTQEGKTHYYTLLTF